MVCSADVNASQSSVATYARCGWSFNIHLTTNLPVQIRQNYGTESVAPLFLAHLVLRYFPLELCHKLRKISPRQVDRILNKTRRRRRRSSLLTTPMRQSAIAELLADWFKILKVDVLLGYRRILFRRYRDIRLPIENTNFTSLNELYWITGVSITSLFLNTFSLVFHWKNREHRFNFVGLSGVARNVNWGGGSPPLPPSFSSPPFNRGPGV